MGGIKLLKASAGSGKTYRLAYEYVRAVIEEPMQYRHILAVTFTNKATEEMKRRIVKEINDIAVGKATPYMADLTKDLSLDKTEIAARATLARTKILHDYGRFSILTIDKFFQRIIRSFIKELGIDLNFNLELQTDSLLSEAADMLIDDMTADEVLRKWIAGFVEEKIGEQRKWEVKEGLRKLGTEIFTENRGARPGSGMSKERLGKIVSALSARAFAVAGTMKAAAGEALGIMADAGLACSDFSGGNRSFSNYFVKTARGRIEPYGASVANALESDEKWYAKTSPRKADIISAIPRLRPLLEKICAVYDDNARLLNSVELLRGNYRNFALLSDLSKKIEQICSAESILPISETNRILNKLVSGNDTPFIFEKAGNHFTRFMIDEFQDTSGRQWENFLPLLRNALSQSDSEPVLLVGDVKQSIYRWRGGDWRILAREIEREFGRVISINLNTNYRSFRNIVEFNNNIVARCVELDNRYLNGLLDSALEAGTIASGTHSDLYGILAAAYEGHRQKASSTEDKGYAEIMFYNAGEDDMYGPSIIERIEDLQKRGYAPGDIAVLVKTNAQGIRVADMLLGHKHDFPNSEYTYDVVTQEALIIGSSPVAGFVMACMKLSASLDDVISLGVYNRWMKAPFENDLPDDAKKFLSGLALMPPEEAFEAIVIRYGLNDNNEDIAYLQALHDQIIRFSDTTVSDIPLFVKWWEERGAGQSVYLPQAGNAITVITIHKAKGLQYRAVLIPYCDWSLAPRANSVVWASADGEDGLEELDTMPVGYSDKMGNSHFADDYFRELVLSHIDNINLFYVAATRAMEELHIMIPASGSSKKKSHRISTLISDGVSVTGMRVKIGNVDGRVEESREGTQIGFGMPCRNTTPGSADIHTGMYTPSFGSYTPKDRLRLRFPSQRYYEDSGTGYALSPRNYGVLMHKVFENASDIADIKSAIGNMERSGEISRAETETLLASIEQAFSRFPYVAQWFDGEWDEIRNENDIIIPGESSPRRPDRVMVRGDEAMVVDYKFGMERPKTHAVQIYRYGELLRRMGYAKVKGYIWYISSGHIEAVVC